MLCIQHFTQAAIPQVPACTQEEEAVLLKLFTLCMLHLAAGT
jgi:hypothetical protein